MTGKDGPPRGWETPSLCGRRGEGGQLEVEKKLFHPLSAALFNVAEGPEA